MSPEQKKKLQKVFESKMSGKWRETKGDLWYYAEDLQNALEAVVKSVKDPNQP